VLRRPRRHALTGHDVNGPDGSESDSDPLPARGVRISLLLPTGPKPNSGWAATLSLDVEIRRAGTGEPPRARVNGGSALHLRESRVGDAGQRDYPVPAGYRRCVYDLPVAVLRDRLPNEIEIVSADGEPILVLALGVDIAFPE
jgi:hypothetical protein